MQAYIEAAMATARYDQFIIGGWFGALSRFHAVVACGDTLKECMQALQADLEGAIDVPCG